MLYVLPDYYPEFHCAAGACQDTCCAGWQIVIDDKSLRRYRACRGPGRKRVFRSILWKKKMFRQDKEKRCAFLNEQNLCDLYTELGPESLCRTCRLYPRHIEEFENVREISLSVSCPEAARLLLNRTEPLRFVEFWREKEESYPDFDELLYSQLTECRSVMLGILQNRSLSLTLRCGLVTGLAYDMQRKFDRGELFSCQELFEQIRKSCGQVLVLPSVPQAQGEQGSEGESRNFDGDSGKRGRREFLSIVERRMSQGKYLEFSWILEMLETLYSYEYLREDWPLWLAEVETLLYRRGEEHYRETEREFTEWLREDEHDWQIPFEQLLVYFLFTYFCGAVYDGEILASAQLGVVHVWLLREMLMAVWLRNGRTLSMEDMQDMVCRYSRELEHSDVNQKKLETLLTRRKLPWLQICGRK